MTINDPTLAASFAAITTPQELRGPDGRVLGRYIPASPTMTFPEADITDEELQRRLNNPNSVWRTPNEVMEHLRQLRKAQ